ncbi:MAG: hypothetical protein R3C52_08620 [Hyphomonadaceae bacterium]
MLHRVTLAAACLVLPACKTVTAKEDKPLSVYELLSRAAALDGLVITVEGFAHFIPDSGGRGGRAYIVPGRIVDDDSGATYVLCDRSEQTALGFFPDADGINLVGNLTPDSPARRIVVRGELINSPHDIYFSGISTQELRSLRSVEILEVGAETCREPREVTYGLSSRKKQGQSPIN